MMYVSTNTYKGICKVIGSKILCLLLPLLPLQNMLSRYRSRQFVELPLVPPSSEPGSTLQAFSPQQRPSSQALRAVHPHEQQQQQEERDGHQPQQFAAAAGIQVWLGPAGVSSDGSVAGTHLIQQSAVAAGIQVHLGSQGQAKFLVLHRAVCIRKLQR